MQRLTQADRACAVAMAAAHDLNDELSIVCNIHDSVLQGLAPDDPLRSGILEAQRSVQRMIWKTSGLLNYGARRGVQPVGATMERLILEDVEKP